ncbi:PH domain-containing protein [Virgisporangium aurantiacum]|uniref:YokE-like PH domain-containing protein n=1 Tax=Virgisporangium aurantiacum TaxID=175570 RepID=A0A8J3ZIG8_9ACTN|nr:PH domain-containing protein [Virgisporangium aurantiacum]GIJ62003.1 hypothetical protein Vau01_095190 [Virgisporangium aurantiacum]
MTRGKKLFEGVSHILEDGETIQHVVDGAYEVDGRSARHGLVVATDRRLLLYALSIYGKHEVDSFSYGSIASFEQSRGLMGGSMSFATADTRATVKLIPPGSTFTRFCTWLHARIAPTPTPVQAQA